MYTYTYSLYSQSFILLYAINVIGRGDAIRLTNTDTCFLILLHTHSLCTHLVQFDGIFRKGLYPKQTTATIAIETN